MAYRQLAGGGAKKDESAAKAAAWRKQSAAINGLAWRINESQQYNEKWRRKPMANGVINILCNHQRIF
jgi:hypothetical protein